MSNYTVTTQSNEFRVKDPDVFNKMFDSAWFLDDDKKPDTIARRKRLDENGNHVFSFAFEGQILGYIEGDEDDVCAFLDSGEEQGTVYDALINKLQQCVADDDAIVIKEIGSWDGFDASACSVVITSKHVEIFDLEDITSQAVNDFLDAEAE